MPSFSHLHCHSQFSLLDGASPIDDMFVKAKADGMRAVALTIMAICLGRLSLLMLDLNTE